MEVLVIPWQVIGIGMSLRTVTRSCGRIVAESCLSCGVAMKSPETVSGIPYINLAEKQLKSSFCAAKMFNKTNGRSLSQFNHTHRADFMSVKTLDQAICMWVLISTQTLSPCLK